MKPLAGLGFMFPVAVLLLAGCGADEPASNANFTTVVEAEGLTLAEQCSCLFSEGVYASTGDCMADLVTSRSQEWLDCANTAITNGGYQSAMACQAKAYEDAVACIAALPCSKETTYTLSSAACVAAALGPGDRCGLIAADEAIAAACDATTGGGLDGGPRRLGNLCLEDADCISGFCMESEYGAPFCTRVCDEPQVDCPAGDDAGPGEALCVSFAEDQLPYPELVDDFQGEADTFCVPRCPTGMDMCLANNESWETCASPKYKANELYPALGVGGNICQSPSHHGKDPVDPTACNYEKTIGDFGGEASLCGFFCDFLETCLFIEKDVFPAGCCEWGCFSRMVPDGDIVDDAWYDDVKCYVDDHNAWPPVGVDNFCNHPPKACGGDPVDPTHPASIPL